MIICPFVRTNDQNTCVLPMQCINRMRKIKALRVMATCLGSPTSTPEYSIYLHFITHLLDKIAHSKLLTDQTLAET